MLKGVSLAILIVIGTVNTFLELVFAFGLADSLGAPTATALDALTGGAIFIALVCIPVGIGILYATRHYKWILAIGLLYSCIGFGSFTYFWNIQTLDEKTSEGYGASLPVYTNTGAVVSWHGVKITDADPKTFKVLSGDWGEDDHAVYHDGTAMVNKNNGLVPDFTIDPKTFTLLSDTYSKDAQHVYSALPAGLNDTPSVLIVTDADPNTFVALGSRYGKDKNSVFYDDGVVSGADVSTFTVVPISDSTDYDAQDIHHKYLYGSEVH